MPLRLYVSDVKRAQTHRIATLNGEWSDVPVLWSILLAQTEACAPIDTTDKQNQGTHARCVTMAAARRRLAFFNGRIHEHPLLYQIPELIVYLGAVDDFLQSLQRRYSFFSRGSVQLIAQHERAHYERHDAAHDDTDDVDEPTACWSELQGVLERREWHRLDEALDFTAYRHGFTKWYAWCRHFGLETLEHPYFQRLAYPSYASLYLTPPEPIAFDAFDANKHTQEAAYADQTVAHKAEEDEAVAEDLDQTSDETDAEHSRSEIAADDGSRYQRWYENYYLHHVGDKVGMVHVTEPSVIESILAPEWDHLQAVWDCWDYLWVRRDGQWGVIHVAHPCETLIAPCVDAIHPAYIRNPMIVEKAHRFGVIDAIQGSWLLPAEYDEIGWHRSEVGDALRVRQGSAWGLLHIRGELIHPCRFDELDNDCSFHRAPERGWRAVQDGKVGWLTNEGKTHLACEWEEIKVSGAVGLYAVRRGGLWGLMAWTESQDNTPCAIQWLPCEYEDVQPLSLSHTAPPLSDPYYDSTGEEIWPEELITQHIAQGDSQSSNVLIRVRRNGLAGLVDQANRILIPFEYDAIELIQCGSYADPAWMRITRNARQGLWSMVERREIFPCVHTSLDVITWPEFDRPTVVTFDPYANGEYACQLWLTDRSPAVEGQFRWVSDDAYACTDQHLGVGKYYLGKMAQALANGEWLRAALITDNDVQIVQLRPGRKPVNEITALKLEYRRNRNLNAALDIAHRYRDGTGVQQDASATYEWAKRACGEEFPDATPSWNAAHLLSTMLYDNLERRDPTRARHWAERAIELCDHPTSPPSEVGLQLARLLLDEHAGTPNPQRAVELLNDIDAPSLDEGAANQLLARCYLDGLGVDRNLDAAHELLARAVACGETHAATELASLLRAKAQKTKGKDARLLQREAEYYETVAATV